MFHVKQSAPREAEHPFHMLLWGRHRAGLSAQSI